MDYSNLSLEEKEDNVCQILSELTKTFNENHKIIS